MLEMKDKRVLVTGAGTGIGRGIALAFARAGVADEPTEARLLPELWGHVRFAASADERGVPGTLEPSSQPLSLDDLFD